MKYGAWEIMKLVPFTKKRLFYMVILFLVILEVTSCYYHEYVKVYNIIFLHKCVFVGVGADIYTYILYPRLYEIIIIIWIFI